DFAYGSRAIRVLGSNFIMSGRRDDPDGIWCQALSRQLVEFRGEHVRDKCRQELLAGMKPVFQYWHVTSSFCEAILGCWGWLRAAMSELRPVGQSCYSS